MLNLCFRVPPARLRSPDRPFRHRQSGERACAPLVPPQQAAAWKLVEIYDSG